ncbi:metal/formaldehyde-sensitive transcriptional repressor [bacterium]|nr:metal/formaldehyde-sensitive transcriptional repressor [bacterium]
MSHLTHDKQRVAGRINRIIGQMEGIRRMLEESGEGDEAVCYKVMQQFAAARGAINSLMQDLLQEHLEHHVLDGKNAAERREGAQELAKVLRSFTK